MAVKSEFNAWGGGTTTESSNSSRERKSGRRKSEKRDSELTEQLRSLAMVVTALAAPKPPPLSIPTLVPVGIKWHGATRLNPSSASSFELASVGVREGRQEKCGVISLGNGELDNLGAVGGVHPIVAFLNKVEQQNLGAPVRLVMSSLLNLGNYTGRAGEKMRAAQNRGDFISFTELLSTSAKDMAEGEDLRAYRDLRYALAYLFNPIERRDHAGLRKRMESLVMEPNMKGRQVLVDLHEQISNCCSMMGTLEGVAARAGRYETLVTGMRSSKRWAIRYRTELARVREEGLATSEEDLHEKVIKIVQRELTAEAEMLSGDEEEGERKLSASGLKVEPKKDRGRSKVIDLTVSKMAVSEREESSERSKEREAGRTAKQLRDWMEEEQQEWISTDPAERREKEECYGCNQTWGNIRDSGRHECGSGTMAVAYTRTLGDDGEQIIRISMLSAKEVLHRKVGTAHSPDCVCCGAPGHEVMACPLADRKFQPATLDPKKLARLPFAYWAPMINCSFRYGCLRDKSKEAEETYTKTIGERQRWEHERAEQKSPRGGATPWKIAGRQN